LNPFPASAAAAAVFSTLFPFATEPVNEMKGIRGCETRVSICEGVRWRVCFPAGGMAKTGNG
jgi:hypothetical protein